MKAALITLLLVAPAYADHYRVPLPDSPNLKGYALIYERINIHDGEVDMAERVTKTPLFKTAALCSKAQMGRFERPDAQGFVKVYFCRPLYTWPKGTEQL